MGKHEAPEPKRSVRRTLVRHALQPVVHISTLVSLHSVALLVVETSLLTLLLIH